jgi:RNA polymerase sigma-70 factor (ECF subfamily)
LSVQGSSGNFEQNVLPHLSSAYNLARWLTRNDQDAQDIVQEAFLRAFNSYHGFRGGDARPWLLKIVRNVFYSSLKKSSSWQFVEFDDDWVTNDTRLPQPERVVIQASSDALVHKALDLLPTRSREMLTLRELEGLSYKEIAAVMDVPTGTVMSTLSRARIRLRQYVSDLTSAGPKAASNE